MSKKAKKEKVETAPVDKRLKVSQSRINSWNRCKYQHHLRYIEKLARRRVRRPFQFGRIIHDMLEADVNGLDPFEKLDEIAKDNKKLFAAEREMYGEIVDDAGLIMEAYFEYYKKDELKFLKKNGQRAEHWFEIELTNDILWNGKIDAAVEAPDDLRYLLENKTFSKQPNDDHRWRNFQSVTYLRAIDLLGWWRKKPFVGTLWNYIKSKPPTKPQLLKNGEAFSIKSIDTLPNVVLEAIEEAGLKKKDNAELIQRAQDNLPNYFKRIRTPVNRDTVDNIFQEFVDSAVDIRDNHDKLKRKTLGQHCDYCDYEPICRAELTGSDVDYVKEHEFYVREDDKKAEEVERTEAD